MRSKDIPCIRPIHVRLAALLTLALVLSVSGFAQRRALTAEDYERAEKFLGYNANPLVLRSGVRPNWLPDDRFWYGLATENGVEFILVDPARGARSAAFNQAKVAEALSLASGAKYEPFRLPFTTFSFEDKGRSIAFNAGGRSWNCDVGGAKCTAVRSTTPSRRTAFCLPDRQARRIHPRLQSVGSRCRPPARRRNSRRTA